MQLARRAFDDVVAEPGRRYNPVFVHGPAGSGKSYFVQALGNAVLATWPDRQVACLSGSAFVEGFVAALQAGTVDRWRRTLRRADVLIVDDVQALAGKARSQEELFHLFNALHARGGQVILTSDRPGRALGELADRLRSRFEGGLAVALPLRGARDRVAAEGPPPREAPAPWGRYREALVLGRSGVEGRVMEGYR
jgi:chromosomal replication initiator protein